MNACNTSSVGVVNGWLGGTFVLVAETDGTSLEEEALGPVSRSLGLWPSFEAV